jgi:cation diffusion facilitator family transporter
MTNPEKNSSIPVSLIHFAWISIAAAVITIVLKLNAYWLTNSVGLLSDALESFVNLLTAIVVLAALQISARPPDEEFTFGYSKIEFFSSGFEGGMILIAAVGIAFAAVQRLLHPQPLDQIGLGLLISASASLVNLMVSRILTQAGKRYGSITLQADARHLTTDVITTGGVIVGVGVVSITRLVYLDPIIALLVAVNILFTGARLLRQSYHGLMDISLPEPELAKIQNILKTYEAQGIKFHAIRSRSAATRKFLSMHILVPGAWSVHHGHKIAEEIENEIRQVLPQIAIFTHVEPIEDPVSWEDIRLEKE